MVLKRKAVVKGGFIYTDDGESYRTKEKPTDQIVSDMYYDKIRTSNQNYDNLKKNDPEKPDYEEDMKDRMERSENIRKIIGKETLKEHEPYIGDSKTAVLIIDSDIPYTKLKQYIKDNDIEIIETYPVREEQPLASSPDFLIKRPKGTHGVLRMDERGEIKEI